MMEKDVVPKLLETIEKEFDEKTLNSSKIKKALQSLKDNKATYEDANNFAIEVGNILSDIFEETIDVSILPDGRMYYNIADRILNPTMAKNHELITGYAMDVQKNLNKKAGLHLKPQIPELNQSRIDGIVNRISSEVDFDVIKWILGDPIVTFSQSVVDDSIKVNADFQAKAGLQPILTRKLRGKACKWCRALAGAYDYSELPKEIYQRHDNCRCTIEYDPGDGKRKTIPSRKNNPGKNKKIESRKKIGIKKPTAK